ncbi:hypothetical protein pb186bvf_013349 [Paramecium bursaria]
MIFYNILINRATNEQNQLILPLLKDLSQPYQTFLFNIIRRVINENQETQAAFLTLLNNSIMDYQHDIGWIRNVPEDISNFMCYKYLNYISDHYAMCIEEPLIIERNIHYKFIVLKIKIEKYLSHPINSYRSQIREITQKITYDKFRGYYQFEKQLEQVLGDQYQYITNLKDLSNIKQYKHSLEWYQKLLTRKKKSYLQIQDSNFGLKDYRLFLCNSSNSKKYAQVFQIQQVIFIDELDHILENLLNFDQKPQNTVKYTSYRNNLKQSDWVETQLDPLLSTNPQFNKYIYFYKYYKIYLNRKDTLTIRRKFYLFLAEVIRASPFNRGRFKKSKYVQFIIKKILKEKSLTNFYMMLCHQLQTFIQKFDKLIIYYLRQLIVECQRLLVHYFKFRFSIHYFLFLMVVQLNLPKQELESKIDMVFDMISDANYKDIQVENYLDILIKQIQPQAKFIIEEQNYQTLNQLDFTFKYITPSLLDAIIVFKSKLGGKLFNVSTFIEKEFINLTNQTTFIPPNFFQNLAQKVKPKSLIKFYMSFQEYREKLSQLFNASIKSMSNQTAYMIQDTNKSRMKYERNLESLQNSYAQKTNKSETEYYNINQKMIKYLNMILIFEIKKCKNCYLKHLLIFVYRKFYRPNKFVLFLKKPLRIIKWINYSFGKFFIKNFERQLYLMIVGGDIYGDLLLIQYDKKYKLEIRNQTLAQQYQMALNVIKHFQFMYHLLDFKQVLIPIIQDKAFFDQFPENDDLNSYHFNFCCYIINLFTNIYCDNCIKSEAGFERAMKFLRKQNEIKEINILTQYKSSICENEIIQEDLLKIIGQEFNVSSLCKQVITYKKNNNIQLSDQEKLFKIKWLVQQITKSFKQRKNRVLFFKFYRSQIKQQTSLSTILYIIQCPNSHTLDKFVSIKKYVFQQMGFQYFDPCPLNVIRLNIHIQKLETTSPDEICHLIQQGFSTFMRSFINKLIFVSQTQRSGDEINIHQTKNQIKVKEKFEKNVKQCIIIDPEIIEIKEVNQISQLQKQCIIIDDPEIQQIEEIDEIEQLMKLSQSYQICEIDRINPLQLDKLQQKQEEIYQNNFYLQNMRKESNHFQMSKQEKCHINVNLLLQQKHQQFTGIKNELKIKEKNEELYNFIDKKKEKYNNNQKNRQISLQNKLAKPSMNTISISLKAVIMVLREDYRDIFSKGKYQKYNYY